MTGQPLSDDPLHDAVEVREYFGDVYPRVRAFAEMLAEQGVERGLIGPREVGRLWERHLLNSAALSPFLGEGRVADVGSGAGLPGMVLAAMDPDRDYVLIEPMERRTQWLFEAARECGIDNVRILRGRAEEVVESVEADVVTARAVAAIDKLVKWCSPLLSPEGRFVLLKGRSAGDELERAKYTLRKHRLTGEVHTAGTIEGVEPTTVVVLSHS
ncbi:16S rRNA (guanine(527)-N(7))-methyltransferase RsmG [Demequina rhizosphaerae]|uniref:16S rRNA (guanine(527)-N(7))-methyltransferase RsmG n=1 Tax=Demequina rhizosphaerae TaxID=1638985 RepID=UPI0007844E50|nr:16S rRNA (guanine(527)-N(7))-methyltransferase RsmG [Demequina rhizosphaerae]